MVEEEYPEEITCPQDGCGRDASHSEEGYYACRCGFFGKDILKPYQDDIGELKYQNERMRALLVDCGYCNDCLWDIESIGDVMVELTEPIWPKDCEPLCVYCMICFKEMFN